MSGSIALESGDVAIETSIGIVLFPRDADTANDVLRNADLALYQAKEKGRGRLEFFKPDMHAAVHHKAELMRELRNAVTQNVGLSLHYQPQIDLATGRVVGFEALIRWNHPTRGSIPPSEFIPIAESSRLIGDLGSWVLHQAATQAKAWLDAGEPPREIAVNMSAAQIRLVDVVQQVAAVLEATRLPPHLLCIELTESLLADNAEGRMRSMLMGLKGLGVGLALDDFGTGYSSLGYLTRLPFDKLKIDRVFIDGVDKSNRARELLKGIVALGRGLGMTVVGEGAERHGEVDVLRQFGCEQAQGYIFSRPTAPADALAFAHACQAGEPSLEAGTDETSSAAPRAAAA
jgi:predicted signal transduction protein with EAL and GGDEF domain